MAKDTGKKLADMLYGGNPEQAAFGVFPQMKGKRSKQDPQAAKNVPVDLLRGAVSGVLGAPGDIESLIRLLPGLDERTILPTSEEIEGRLPFKSDTPVSRAATGLGQLGGGFYTGPGSPFRLVGAIPSAVKRAGQDFAMAAAESGPKIFIGPKAKTWNQAKADAAARMEKEGIDPGLIWQQTGTFRGADGIWRQEIDDRAAKFLMPDERQERVDTIKQKIGQMQEQIKRTPQKDLFPKALTEAKKEVRDDIDILKGEVRGRTKNPRTQGLQADYIFEHPELYKAYPELRNVNVVTEGSGGPGTRGALSIIPSRGFIPGKIEMDVYDMGLLDNPTSTTLHEMQHAVQTLEGMGPGGNPTFAFSDPRAHDILTQLKREAQQPPSFEEFQKVNKYPEDEAQSAYAEFLKEREKNPVINPKVERALQERAAMEYYKRLAGEAEARAVQDRQLMTPAQRMENPPPASYDVPQEDLIVKPPREYADGGRVHISDNPDTMALELAGGGLVGKLAKLARAASDGAGYRPHTPLKPDPDVGTRYKKEYIGGLAPRQDLNIEDLEKSSAKIFPWDATSRNQLVTEVSERPLANPVLTEGGDEYMMDLEHIKNRIAGASNIEIAKRIKDRIDQAAVENQMLGGTGKVYGFPIRMAERAENFSTFPADIAMDLLRQGDLSKKELKSLHDDLRSMVFEGKGQYFKNVAPVGSPDFDVQLREGLKKSQGKKGEELSGFTAGNLRKGLMDRLSKVEYQKRLGYNYPDLVGAVLSDELKGVPKGYVGNVAAELDPFTSLRPSKSSTYSHDFSGQYVGSMPNMPVEFLMPNTFEAMYMEMKSKYPGAKPEALRNMAIGAMEKRKEKISEMIGPRTVDAVKTFQEGLMKGEFDPNDIKQVYDYMRRKKLQLKMADGGEVHGLSSQDMLFLQSQDDLAKLPPQAQREYITNMGGQELRQRMASKYAGGGDISADDLILEERKL